MTGRSDETNHPLSFDTIRSDLILALDGFDLHGYSLLFFHACSYGMTQLPHFVFA